MLSACSGSPQDSAQKDTQASAATSCASSTVVSFPIPQNPLFTLDPIGPLSDVTCDWQHYQPAQRFCVKLDDAELTPGGTGPTPGNGSDPACAQSGFAPDDTGLYIVDIDTPILCPGCRRYFIDLSNIPAPDDSSGATAHGHAFYALASFNFSYTIDPYAHSPNTKNFTNDALVTPPGTPLQTVIGATDMYDKAYVTHTTKFAHTGVQGPYYIGPWYVNRDGERIHGVYLDVDVTDAVSLGNPQLNALRYLVGYNSGRLSCPDNLLANYAGADFLYAGCVDQPGTSSIALDPLDDEAR
ncbi:MAG TPA: hypothetical protein VHE37_08605 [Nevskiaceae bacterium]|nr:hypothetical protein [Nevskiaceae bacterium]